MLSGVPAAAPGQVKVRPLNANGAPGVSPAAARACAEKLLPPPSRPPSRAAGLWSASSAIEVLLKPAASDGYGTCVCAPDRPACVPPAVSRTPITCGPGPCPDGTLTCHVVETVAPAGTVGKGWGLG